MRTPLLQQCLPETDLLIPHYFGEAKRIGTTRRSTNKTVNFIKMNLSTSLHGFYEMFIEPISKKYSVRDDEMVGLLPAPPKQKLQRQMTSLGRFAFRSQTEENPSVITFFVALAHEAGKELDLKEFQGIWEKRVVDKHERFRCHISREDDRLFEVGFICFTIIRFVTDFSNSL